MGGGSQCIETAACIQKSPVPFSFSLSLSHSLSLLSIVAYDDLWRAMLLLLLLPPFVQKPLKR